ncbi:ribonuclease HII [Xanthomonadaceae bacterium JHOS43]|nr:ribonuclease HII [Xanthomonadaceae bacterium JHOS43]MCX7563331.1 ribonuclease HII [Xanthomonadaceae bacterium XH05]
MRDVVIAGVDEAGRGPLAGPLVVAAVILDPERPIDGIGDSKALSEKKRELLFGRIREQALAYCVRVIDVGRIDELNIFQATMHGMRESVAGLAVPPTLARIDGNRIPPGLPCDAEAWVGGDARDAAIGAASILAKVARDRLMMQCHARWPQYGFARHKGYGTPEHLAALHEHGPCPEHRRSFAPVKLCGATDLFGAPAG